MIKVNGPVLSQVRNLGEDASDFGDTPDSVILIPIYREVKKQQHSNDIVAVVNSILPWRNYFLDLLPDGIEGIVLVMSNTCNQTWSYEINGPDVEYLGVGDFHQEKYTPYLVDTSFNPFGNEMECAHTLSLYPSEKFESTYATNKPTGSVQSILGAS